MKRILIVLLVIVISLKILSGQIIDVHMHVYNEKEYQGGQKHPMGPDSPNNADEFYKQIVELMDRHNIEYALISGSPETIKEWKAKDKRFIGGLQYTKSEQIDTVQFKKLIEEGVMDAWAEMASAYRGETLADPKFEPFLRICERYDIPVGYHTGNTFPGTAYSTPFRVSKADPMLIEEVLAKYPNLRIYLMHAGGGSFSDKTIELMYQYPHVYVDIAVLLWIDHYAKYNVIKFLRHAKEARLLDRVMFGSDQMIWPEAITMSIDYLNSMDFLTEEEKHMIFYTNAKKFFGLE